MRVAPATVLMVALSGLSAPATLAQVEENEESDDLDEIVVVGRTYLDKEVTVGKGPVDILDLPQTANVITRQRIEDQFLTTLPELLQQATGVTVEATAGAGINTNFFVRGYFVDTILLDGLPEIDTVGSGFSTAFDTAMYERVEIVKGPAGLYIGAGEPGAILNLVRKRASAETNLTGTLTVGSFDRIRGQIDATGALNESGKIRGRMVALYDDSESFQDVVNSERAMFYGTLEFDLAERTTLRLGAAHQEIDSVLFYGLPAFADGTLLDVPRSTFIGADWNQLDPTITDVFAVLEHDFTDGSVLKVAGRYFDRELIGSGAFASSAVDPMTGDVDLTTLGFTSNKDGVAFDAYFSKPFEFAGLDHNFVIGADYRQSEDDNIFEVGPGLTQNVFDPEYALPGPDFFFEFPLNPTETDQMGVYTQARFALPGSLTAVLGGRLTWWDTETRDVGTGDIVTERSVDDEFTPYAALLWQGLDNHTFYLSFAEIFQPQESLDINNETLRPRTGQQFEVGVKGEYLDGRLLGQLSVYRIEDTNRALPDPDSPPGLGASIAAGEVRSEGFEAELVGEILPNLNLTAGYAYVETEFEEGTVDQQGQPFSTFTPQHIYNLWANYQQPSGALKGLDVGIGLRTVSSFFSEQGGARFEGDGYTIVQARIGYAINDNFGVSLVGNNLLDERYYERVSAATRQNYLGAPLSATLILQARF